MLADCGYFPPSDLDTLNTSISLYRIRPKGKTVLNRTRARWVGPASASVGTGRHKIERIIGFHSVFGDGELAEVPIGKPG